ncbi:hypothetical protein QQF64_033438 [Cirrhinus molitorella]|uniref:Uncharacterized protein n=1 Tax=Cirrhinus molitorella TaxID=172907 RepID=A0ABR3MU39_9TELE
MVLRLQHYCQASGTSSCCLNSGVVIIWCCSISLALQPNLAWVHLSCCLVPLLIALSCCLDYPQSSNGVLSCQSPGHSAFGSFSSRLL